MDVHCHGVVYFKEFGHRLSCGPDRNDPRSIPPHIHASVEPSLVAQAGMNQRSLGWTTPCWLLPDVLSRWQHSRPMPKEVQ